MATAVSLGQVSTSARKARSLAGLSQVGEHLQQIARHPTLSGRVENRLRESCNWLEGCIEDLQSELAEARAAREEQQSERHRIGQRFDTLLEMLPAAVILLDARGRVAEANSAAEAMLSPFLTQPLSGSLWREITQFCFDPRPDDGHEISLKDGRRVALATCPLPQEPGQILMLTDQTATRELQKRNARMERLSAMGRMLAAVAHQIRTPLSAAMLYAGHLQKDLSDEQRQRFAGRISERLQHLENQLRDMLIFARGDLPLTDHCTLEALVGELEKAVEPVAERHACSIDWQVRAPVGHRLLINRDALVGALMNLVENAIEWAPQQPVRITVRQYHRWLRLSVTDRGPGMDAAQRQQAREPFFTTRARGTGLGLAVAEAVARAHGGRFALMSQPGRGTTAGLLLPLAAIEEK